MALVIDCAFSGLISIKRNLISSCTCIQTLIKVRFGQDTIAAMVEVYGISEGLFQIWISNNLIKEVLIISQRLQLINCGLFG